VETIEAGSVRLGDKKSINTPLDYGAMTFKEIAECMGISRQAVSETYTRAMRKIRRRKDAIALLVGLIEAKQSMRENG
jgi:predicted DNA-binding protein (UPF0251 family)